MTEQSEGGGEWSGPERGDGAEERRSPWLSAAAESASVFWTMSLGGRGMRAPSDQLPSTSLCGLALAQQRLAAPL